MSEGFRCFLADPPWLERGGGKVKRGADRHYPLLRPHEIVETMLVHDLWHVNPDGAHLWLWVTNNHLRSGLLVMEALGFRYVTNAAWVKDRIGLGQYLRGKHELLLFGVRGRLPALVKTQPTVIEAPRGRHSQKPEASYQLIEAVTPGPRVEFFARTTRPGWWSTGNEIEPC